MTVNDRWRFGAVVGDPRRPAPLARYLRLGGFVKSRLGRNNFDGTFTAKSPSAPASFHRHHGNSGATWGDYDSATTASASSAPATARLRYGPSAWLDIYLAATDLRGARRHRAEKLAASRATHDKLFRNNHDGTFTDVSVKAGVQDEHAFYGLASLFIDLNGDGRPDLLVADDSTPNYLYLNKGNGTFEDTSFASGYALNESGRETASMGIAAGDYAHNGLIDLYNTTFSDDYKPLYRNDGDANFTDISYQAGIAEPTIPFLSWGTAFFDYDNDGWLDLLTVNGHVYPEVDQQSWGTTFAQRAFLMHNVKGKFEFVPPVEGTGLAKLAVARGLAYGDLFNDGRVDVVINNLDSAPSLFRNITDEHNHWIAFQLTGSSTPGPTGKASPRDAVGAVVYVTASGFRQRQDIIAGGSFASSPDQRPHFGLGPATKIDRIEIHWPSGLKQDVTPPPKVDAFYTIIEGKPLEPVR